MHLKTADQSNQKLTMSAQFVN